jgi:SAM-dependent methyltransferase/glycosyltransferase involved in cell wall biosynthesis
MLILIYSETNKSTITQNLGRAEYSYYFVLKEFRPVLERLGTVLEVTDPDEEVDRLYGESRARGEECVFLSFSPPHRTATQYACPTIPVLAWEFSSIPDETWNDDPRHDWRNVLGSTGAAITHSSHTVNAVRNSMGADFPITAIPSPVWDRFRERSQLFQRQPLARQVKLKLKGLLVDSRTTDLRAYAPVPSLKAKSLDFKAPVRELELTLDGVIYTSVFNPCDGRKNWEDMISAFCTTFREVEDATLVLKLTHFDAQQALGNMLPKLYQNQPYRCRIVLIYGYLADPDYELLVQATTYVVNTSHGEGQCLPLMEFMSCGKPAVAPSNTAMGDYVDADNTFIIESTEELTCWPHDPRFAYRTLRYTTNWASLCQAYQASYQVARYDGDRYAAMSTHAIDRLEAFCSQERTYARLKVFMADVLEQHKTHGKPIDRVAAIRERKDETAVQEAGVFEGADSPRDCGLQDAVLDGWFLHDTGELLKGFAITPDDTFLDVGCGEGGSTMFAVRQGASVIFTDSELDKVQDVARRVAADSDVVSLGLVSNSLPLPLRDGCASKIVCTEVLEHVDEPEQFMAELVRMGRPGAQYLISVPDPVGEHLQKGIAPPSYYQSPNHIQIFSRERFAELVESAGLVIERRQSSGFFWVMGMIFFWASERARGNDLSGAVRDRIHPPYPPLMQSWARTWKDLMAQPDGLAIKQLLDQFMPKSQVIIARKPADAKAMPGKTT